MKTAVLTHLSRRLFLQLLQRNSDASGSTETRSQQQQQRVLSPEAFNYHIRIKSEHTPKVRHVNTLRQYIFILGRELAINSTLEWSLKWNSCAAAHCKKYPSGQIVCCNFEFLNVILFDKSFKKSIRKNGSNLLLFNLLNGVISRKPEEQSAFILLCFNDRWFKKIPEINLLKTSTIIHPCMLIFSALFWLKTTPKDVNKTQFVVTFCSEDRPVTHHHLSQFKSPLRPCEEQAAPRGVSQRLCVFFLTILPTSKWESWRSEKCPTWEKRCRRGIWQRQSWNDSSRSECVC